MKRIISHPEPSAREIAGPQYWRSSEELANSPAFNEWLQREFPENASIADESDRRTFLKLMGASIGLAGLGLVGCRAPTAYILPYSKQPEFVIPGVPLFYASSQPTARDNIPLVVETHEARPTKIEGNPSYTPYGGATSSFAQASVLDLYDPDRLRESSRKNGAKLTRSEVLDLLTNIRNTYQTKDGKGLAVLVEGSTSPTRQRLIAELQKAFPKILVAEYNAVDTDNSERALKALTGKRLRAIPRLAEARRVLALDSDFLSSGPGALQFARDFAKARRVKDKSDATKMNRLYAVESNFTLTGGMADHRLRAASSHIPAFTALVVAEILRLSGAPAAEVDALRAKGQGLKVDPEWIRVCAKDLYENKGASVIVAGYEQPEVVHQMVALANEVLSAPIDYYEVNAPEYASISDLSAAVTKGDVDTLIIVGGNPVYDAPSDLNFKDLLGKVENVVRYGYYRDETALAADYVIAANHYLESWGDGRTFDGTYVPVQPMILPLFEGFSEVEILNVLLGQGEKEPYEQVRTTFNQISGSNDQLAFNAWLTEGLLKDSAFPKAKLQLKRADAFAAVGAASFAPPQVDRNHIEIRIVPSSHTYDGRYNNNGWLMELPDPMTKLTWDNAICVSPKLGKELGILPQPIQMDRMGQLNVNANQFEDGREKAWIGRLEVDGRVVEGPMHVLPGLADYTVVVTLGFGRTATGRIGTQHHYPYEGKPVGYNAYPLRTTSARAVVTGAKIEKLDQRYYLANTQEHWSMEGRAIIREANNTEYAKNPDFVNQMGMESHSPPIYGADRNMPLSEKVTKIPRGGSAYKTPDFTAPQQWGMVIDLNTCLGCNSCVVACQSENNIPIVGKDQVLRGREMHWIRLDRYFSSGRDTKADPEATLTLPEDPQVSFMGVACAQCELAPCESVCPVNATVHDEQGLNVMAYNRCVGTRYCANNCPYKVRRFNFFDYNKRDINELYKGPLGKNEYKTEDSQFTRMQKNPNVSIRMRGVMEKCTYCVQRIESAKINQKVKAKDSPNILVPDGTIQTACQQVCPTNSIVFGDIADPNTEVSKAKNNDRNYALLGYLNIRPRTTYLAKLRNPNPEMPGYRDMPLTRAEYELRYGHGAHDKSHDDHSHAASSGADHS